MPIYRPIDYYAAAANDVANDDTDDDAYDGE